MRGKSFYCALLTLLLIMVWPAWAQEHDHDHEHAHIYTGETAYYLAEHGDFKIGLEDGQFEFHIHLHAGTIVDGEPLAEDTVFAPFQLIVVATHEAIQPRPAAEIWHATGADVNEPLWVLPQHKREGLPGFGVSTTEIDLGTLVDDMVTLELRYCQGPGDVSLWADDAFGHPSFLLSTHAWKLAGVLPVGLHAHYNWAFAKPGIYTLVFEVSGNLIAGGSARAVAVYTFLVSDGPVVLHKPLGDVNGDRIVDEADLTMVQAQMGQTAVIWPGSDQDDITND